MFGLFSWDLKNNLMMFLDSPNQTKQGVHCTSRSEPPSFYIQTFINSFIDRINIEFQ